MSTPREPYLHVTVGAPPEAVWRALRDPEEIGRWFGWEYEGLEDEIALIFHGVMPEGIELPPDLDTAIEVDEEARSLRTGAHLIRVDAEGDGAVVRVTRVVDVGDEGWEAFHAEIDHIEEGWTTFFQTLAFAAARHPGAPRATVFGMGALAGDPLATLGLAGVAAGPGERYAATLATGDDLAGEVWFRSAHQLGLTVEGWGDGLLVVGVLPGGTDGASPVMAVASTYGLPDDTLTALRDRWAGWWAAHSVDG